VLDRLTDRLGQWATRRNVLVFVALELLMTAVVLPLAQARIQALSGGVGQLDLRFSYSPAEVYAALVAYGPAGRDFYVRVDLTADMAYPIIYSLFFSLTITYFLRRQGAVRPVLLRLALVPFAAMIADYLENACLVALLLSYPARIDTLAQVSSLFTSIKWVLAAVSLALLIISGAAVVILRRQRPDPAPP
jgi:hypothetical protein